MTIIIELKVLENKILRIQIARCIKLHYKSKIVLTKRKKKIIKQKFTNHPCSTKMILMTQFNLILKHIYKIM